MSQDPKTLATDLLRRRLLAGSALAGASLALPGALREAQRPGRNHRDRRGGRPDHCARSRAVLPALRGDRVRHSGRGGPGREVRSAPIGERVLTNEATIEAVMVVRTTTKDRAVGTL